MPVKNAADPQQIDEARKRESYERKEQLADLREILMSDAGRRVMWRLLKKAKKFESVWDSSARIHYNAGQQDFGHFLMGEIVEAQPDALLQMMIDAKRKEDLEK